MATTQSHPIVSGPSKWDLSVALFDKTDGTRTVSFKIEHQYSIILDLSIDSIQAKDSSKESWNIEGVVYDAKMEKGWTKRVELPETGTRVFVYFRTDSRQGHLRFF